MEQKSQERKITLKEWQDVLAVMNRYNRDAGWVDNENLDKLTFFDGQPSTGGCYVTREDVKRYIKEMEYKLARVVMIPLNKCGYATGDLICNNKGRLKIAVDTTETYDMWKAQHLYFVANDEIGPDEFGIINHPDYGLAIMANHKVQTTDGNMRAYDFWKAEGKVIATTDPSLKLPSIPASWIRDVYVPANGKIEHVLLKTVEESGDFTDSVESRMLHCVDNQVVILQ